jgi:hypothetical protein
MFKNAWDLIRAFAAVRDAGSDDDASPSSTMSDWRNVRYETESLAGFERNEEI